MQLPPGPFTPEQLRVCDILTRISACLSLTGILFTTTSYIFCPALRKPFNRLAFVIAIANTFGCLSYSWGYHALFYPRTSAFCQTQGFLIQWFVMADPFVVLTMAVSVWSTVQARRTPDEIRRFENIGISLAFLLPFIPAFMFLFYRPGGQTVYGPAILWCFVSQQSSQIRIFAFYVPIWTAIACSLILFALSGRRILHIRAQVSKAQSIQSEPHERRHSKLSFKGFSFTNRQYGMTSESSASDNEPQYPAAIHPSGNDAPLSPTQTPTLLTTQTDLDLERFPTVVELNSAHSSRRHSQATAGPVRRRSTRFDTMHWKYARFAFSCTIVLFITWIPISINRMRAFLYPNDPIYGLYVASAVCIPLHGFGNFVIYVNTSWEECKNWTLSLFECQCFSRFSRSRRQDRSIG